MKIKIVHDQIENEYIAFVDGISNISGYGETEKLAILNLLYNAECEVGFNHKTVRFLIDKIENET